MCQIHPLTIGEETFWLPITARLSSNLTPLRLLVHRVSTQFRQRRLSYILRVSEKAGIETAVVKLKFLRKFLIWVNGRKRLGSSRVTLATMQFNQH